MKDNNLEKGVFGKFPIMLRSNLCILKELQKEVRFNAGECRDDNGGYFIIDGKEKVIVSQEKFADNMLYVKKTKKTTNTVTVLKFDPFLMMHRNPLEHYLLE